MKPKVSIGMFTHNEEKHLEEAIESLLAQTYKDFSLIILDDNSTDKTPQIIEHFAKKDKRILFYKNTQRMGYAANYRKTFELAGPDIDYFAWAAGHDKHEPRYLESLVNELNTSPNVVMAYPLIERIADNGESLNIPSTIFETKGLNELQRINKLYLQGVGFGNMIYGLFRANALPRVGVFQNYIMPDIFILWKLSLFGTFSQVHEVLWIRRYPPSIVSVKRQRKNAFARAPWYTYLPYPFVNAVAIFIDIVIFPNDLQRWPSRFYGFYMSLLFFIHFTKLEIKKILMNVGFIRNLVLNRNKIES